MKIRSPFWIALIAIATANASGVVDVVDITSKILGGIDQSVNAVIDLHKVARSIIPPPIQPPAMKKAQRAPVTKKPVVVDASGNKVVQR